jgi:hypothetical protein
LEEEMKIYNKLLIAILAAFLTGCTGGLKTANVEKMIPPRTDKISTRIKRTLKINRISSTCVLNSWLWGFDENDSPFSKALIRTLSEENIFTEVNPSIKPDLNLEVTILSNDCNVEFGYVNRFSSLVVLYRINSGLSNKKIWQKVILSYGSADLFKDAFYAIQLRNKSFEICVSDNINQLIDELGKIKL